ncbi:MAG: hypothetical protein NT145_03175 [Elusimicrobia bacterium]|nr:hypothetical protein [Elusimicrobiota bacterium]
MKPKIISIILVFFVILNILGGGIFIEISSISSEAGIFYKLPIFSYASKLCSLPIEILNSFMKTNSSFNETSDTGKPKSEKAKNSLFIVPISANYELTNFFSGILTVLFLNNFYSISNDLINTSSRCPPDFITRFLCLFMLFLILRPRSSIPYEAVIYRKIFKPGL